MSVITGLEAGSYLLQPIVRTDLPFVFRGLSDPEVVRYYGVSYSTLRETNAQMDFYERIDREGTGIAWKIVSRSTGLFQGVIAAYQYQPDHERIEIGFWLLKEFQGKGILAETIPVAIEHLANRFRLHRIEAMVEKENLYSCRLLEKLGFEKEGILRDYEIKDDHRISLVVYSLLLEPNQI